MQDGFFPTGPAHVFGAPFSALRTPGRAAGRLSICASVRPCPAWRDASFASYEGASGTAEVGKGRPAVRTLETGDFRAGRVPRPRFSSLSVRRIRGCLSRRSSALRGTSSREIRCEIEETCGSPPPKGTKGSFRRATGIARARAAGCRHGASSSRAGGGEKRAREKGKRGQARCFRQPPRNTGQIIPSDLRKPAGKILPLQNLIS